MDAPVMVYGGQLTVWTGCTVSPELAACRSSISNSIWAVREVSIMGSCSEWRLQMRIGFGVGLHLGC